MIIKSPLILLAALLGSKIVVGSCGGVGGIRALGQDVPETSTPLEEVVTADGAIVRFYEAEKGSGMLAVASSVPKGIRNPIHSYVEKADVEGATKKSIEEFYVQITGKSPSGLLLEALRQQKLNEDSEGERKGWRVEASEVAAPSDESGAAGAGGGQDRQLCLNCDPPFGSQQWFLNTECRSVTEYDWCRCLTYRTGSGYKVQTSDDFFQGVYVYRGGMHSQLEFWSCPGGTCRWKNLIGDGVLEGWHSLIWAQGGGSWTYKGSTAHAEGDGYHVSWYDAADSDVGCQVGGGLGCYVCPNID